MRGIRQMNKKWSCKIGCKLEKMIDQGEWSCNTDCDLEKDGWLREINRTTKRLKHKVKLIVKLKAIKFKKASSAFYLLISFAKPF